MEEKLDFSLPAKKSKTPFASIISVLLLVVLVGLAVINLFDPFCQNPPSENPALSLSQEKVKDLASKLADRSLYTRAAEVWQDYLASAEMPDAERAKILFQIGTLLEKAGRYDEAIEYFYRSEITAALPELEQSITAHIRDCFEKLGKFSALRYELMDRTSIQPSGMSGGKIVAEIGAEKITNADLDALIEKAIDDQLAPLAAFMTAEQRDEQKTKVLEQYKAPSARQEFLQSWLVQEVLYRQAMEEELSEQPDVKRFIEGVVRGALSQQLMNKELADKIHITESDLQTYYQANKADYVEPAKARIGHILVKDRPQADELIKRINNGEDFGELAKAFSADPNTQDSGGMMDADVKKGDDVPGIGKSAELNEKILAADTGDVLQEPFKTEKGWEIIKVCQKDSPRQKTFEEVKQQVTSSLLNQKRQDVQGDLIRQMMDKYGVIIHTSALTDTEQNKTGNSSDAAKEQP
ncbi:MAG: peptidyl-prolyl cis-trans isomerase [Planctomycetales bacterium]|nr:peptidyl-prolyl cis-trans isomerase [Planctomycetales bacterium]